MKFLNFSYLCGSFLPSWIRIRIPNPDTDPLTWLNPEPIRIWNTSYDALTKGRVVQWPHHPRDALSMGRNNPRLFVRVTYRSGGHFNYHVIEKEWLKISCLIITPNTVQVWGGEPPSLQQPREPRDAVGRLGDCGRDEPEQARQAGEALPEDCAALSRGAELQLHVRHHVGARTQRCLQVCWEINPFFAGPVFRIHRIHMFLGLSDPVPLVRGMDPNPDPSIIEQE